MGAVIRQVTLLVVLVCAGAVRVSSQEPAADGLSNDDRQLVVAALAAWKIDATSALVDSTMPICPGDRATLCLRQDAVMARNLALDYLDAGGLRERFLARNDGPHSIGALTPEHRRVPRDRVTPMFAPGGLQWSAVYRTFIGVRTLTQVSAPAYSADGSQALVYVEMLCSPRCGRGGLLLFDRKSGGWSSPRAIRQWIEQ
jgi:hypothetical protein